MSGVTRCARRHGLAQWAAVWILCALCLGGCDALVRTIALAALTVVLVGGLLIQAGCLVVALLPLARKPFEEEPDLRAPSGPTALGVAGLVCSGLVEWLGFVVVMHRDERALLGHLALAAFLASAVVHGLTLAFVLFSHRQEAPDGDQPQRPGRARAFGVALAAVYWMGLIAAGLWPWLAAL